MWKPSAVIFVSKSEQAKDGKSNGKGLYESNQTKMGNERG